MSLFDIFHMVLDEEKQNLTIISKWECDESQQAQYKQVFQ